MSMLGILSVLALLAAISFRLYRTTAEVSPNCRPTDVVLHRVVTDLRVCSHPLATPCVCKQGPRVQVIEKDLYLHRHPDGQKAWLCLEWADETGLADGDLVVTSIVVGERPSDPPADAVLEERLGKIWLLKQEFRKQVDQAVTGVDVLYGEDAVDPRPQWNLMQASLQLDAFPEIPVARLTIRHGRAKPKLDAQVLRIPKDGKFSIVQVSDAHMGTGPGVCHDAMDAHGKYLGPVEADPRTVAFIEKVLEESKPNLVILAGDQIHHGVDDSQTPLFKLIALMEARRLAYATVFGNHDNEGDHASSRTEQMTLLESLPNCLSKPGPEEVDGVGNYIVQVFAAAPSEFPVLTLYLLDSHGAIPGFLGKLVTFFRNGYDYIKRSQIEWFLKTSEDQRKKCEHTKHDNAFRLSLAFFHIPLPEFGNCDSSILTGLRREPTEGPIYNSHFYEALAKQGIAAIGTGHDHLNDFVAQLPRKAGQKVQPYLCSGGSAGFGGYGQYAGRRTFRQARVFDLDVNTRSLTTWMHVEHRTERVDEIVLVKDGVLLCPLEQVDGGRNCAVQ